MDFFGQYQRKCAAHAAVSLRVRLQTNQLERTNGQFYQDMGDESKAWQNR